MAAAKSKKRVKFVKRAQRKFVRMAGPPGSARLGRDVDVDISTTMGGGVCEFTNIKMPWTVKYDEYFYGLSGTLTIRGVSRDVEIPLRVTALADRYLADGQVTLRLSDFRIPIPRFFIFVAEDPVVVTLKIRLTRP